MMTGMTLVEFLLARLDERETVAQRALTAVRRWPKSQPPPWEVARLLHAQLPRSAGHLEAWEGRETPADVLADVAAKRAIVEHVSRWEHDNPDDGGYYSCPLVPDSSRALDEDWDGESCWCGLASRQLAILGPLARPYAGRADYQQEWAP